MTFFQMKIVICWVYIICHPYSGCQRGMCYFSAINGLCRESARLLGSGVLPCRCFVDQFVVVLACLKARLTKNLHQIPIIFHTAGMKNCQNRYLLG